MTQRAFGGRLVVALGLAAFLGLAGPADAQTSTREVQKEQAGSDKPLSDAWLTAKTKLALLADEDVSGTAINVDTSNGVVSLKGEVEDPAAKAKALEIARGIEGVRDVKDELRVATAQSGGQQSRQSGQSGTTAPAKRDDEQIAQEVRKQIQQNWTSGPLRADGDTLKGPQDTQIEVNVDDGVVTLEGQVPDVQDIVKAAEAARRVQGVRSVKTNIESGQRS